jgi:GNAT superfamily N-acetyltransferase
MTPPLYRIAGPRDIDQLIELRLRMQADVHPGQSPAPDYEAIVRDYFTRTIADGSSTTAVAEAEGRIISTATVIVYEKTPSYSGMRGLAGYISNVYTDPAFRGRGIATEVMRKVVEHASERGVDKLHLTATSLGKGVYERVGFVPPQFVALELRIPRSESTAPLPSRPSPA